MHMCLLIGSAYWVSDVVHVPLVRSQFFFYCVILWKMIFKTYNQKENNYFKDFIKQAKILITPVQDSLAMRSLREELLRHRNGLTAYIYLNDHDVPPSLFWSKLIKMVLKNLLVFVIRWVSSGIGCRVPLWQMLPSLFHTKEETMHTFP